jgi:hypothetical protein
MKARKNSSRRMCCVVGCHNNEGENPELRFHCFPGRAWEKERRANWIRAVNRGPEYVFDTY